MRINILLMHWWPFLHLISEGNTTAGTAVSTLTPINRLLPGNCCIRLWGGFLFKFQRNEVPWKHNIPVSAVFFRLKQTGTLCANKLDPDQAVITSAVNKVRPDRSKDDAGDEDKSSNQEEGNEIEHHQESQEQEEGLDATSKVTCWDNACAWSMGWRSWKIKTKHLMSTWNEWLKVYLRSFATSFSTVQKSREILWCCLWVYAEIWPCSVSRTPGWKQQEPASVAPVCNGQVTHQQLTSY